MHNWHAVWGMAGVNSMPARFYNQLSSMYSGHAAAHHWLWGTVGGPHRSSSDPLTQTAGKHSVRSTLLLIKCSSFIAIYISQLTCCNIRAVSFAWIKNSAHWCLLYMYPASNCVQPRFVQMKVSVPRSFRPSLVHGQGHVQPRYMVSQFRWLWLQCAQRADHMLS